MPATLDMNAWSDCKAAAEKSLTPSTKGEHDPQTATNQKCKPHGSPDRRPRGRGQSAW